MEQVRQNFNNGMKLIKEMEKIFEMWHKIEGYDNYSISSFGRVRNDKTNKILKLRKEKYGYNRIDLNIDGNRKALLVHRLVAKIFVANLDNKDYVDHIDGNRTNNNISNLRWATNQENQFNRKINKDNSSGTKGVSWDKAKNKWQVNIHINKKQTHCGYFDHLEDAIKIRKQMEKEHYGEFARK